MRIRGVLAFAVLAAGMLVATGPAPSRAEVDPGCTETEAGYRCVYGPIRVRAGRSSMGTKGVTAPPEAGYVTWARATLLDETGRRVPQHAVHLHHAVWANPLRDDMTCPGWPFERFFATGKERTKIVLPAGYGYHWATGSVWGLNYHLDSHHETGDVYLSLNMGYVLEADAVDMTGVTPVWLDVDNCDDSEFNVPKNVSRGNYRRAWNFTMPQGGRFVALAGHLHDGGIRLKLRNLTTGEYVFTSSAVYERRWNLRAMTTYSDAAGKPVASGDVLRLTAVYDDDRAWRRVMGIMIGALALDG